ncbi:aminoacyltransferase [Streptococcus danieliae]|uniref:Aminoacyltransferase FemA n=1 Tax=Streptococcus danieliae TaxID=747656 RepID=A0A7Z0LBQ6_9STRE|nr:aminoacyltransferase [Streptococcus danieliae]MBF0716623.1 aminoacyltransferase [Streptococcus danieliae]NYS48553.1 aminoacyltransferase [Streptococcus danieliae]
MLETITLQEFEQLHVEKQSYMQSPEMASLLEKRGYTVEFLAYKENNRILVATMLQSMPMTGGLHMEITLGPLVFDASGLKIFYQELQNYAKQKGALELLVFPDASYQDYDSNGQPTGPQNTLELDLLQDLGFQFQGFQTGYTASAPNWVYLKDLTGLDQKSLLNSFTKNGKALVKKANTFGIKLRPLSRAELSLFKEVTEATSSRRDFSDKDLAYYEAFFDSFGQRAEFMAAFLNFQEYTQEIQKGHQALAQKIAKLEERPPSTKRDNQLREFNAQLETFQVRLTEAKDLVAKYGDEDVLLAASLFLYMPEEAVYLFSGSYPEFNKFYAPALLQEYVMKEAMKRDIRHYNLLGIMGEFDGSDGVLRFKQNFNGSISQKVGTFTYFPSPLKAKLLRGLKKIIGR